MRLAFPHGCFLSQTIDSMKIPTLALLFSRAAAAAPAQIMTEASPGYRALDRLRSQPARAGHVTEIEDETDRAWRINAATGWDSLYMDRGVNVLGNGNGLYWWAIDVELEVWEGGTVTPGVWYGVGSHWDHAQPKQAYKEWQVFVDFTQTFGHFSISTGWEYVYVPMEFEAENEIYVGLAYDWSFGQVTITPSTTWFYSLGPEKGTPGGAITGGASYWLLGLDADIPLARNGTICLAPWTAYGLNFNYNERGGDPLVGKEGRPFIGGNNLEFGIAVPIQFSRWFSAGPYVAYSYQWQNLGAGAGSRTGLTAESTWWTGVSANFQF
jgi:hypothetical protein